MAEFNLSHGIEPEFEQARDVILNSLTQSKIFEKNPDLKRCIPVIVEPERVIEFRVTWEDDKGNARVNRGYRVQFNSALGPYKGGLRFHPSVNLSILKFLGFEQIFKNALTGLPIGGGKGGSDFDPHDKSDNEIRRFCQAFMTELHRHIGADIDVPAGDIGVGGREVGYLYGAYKRLQQKRDFGVLTGKDTRFGLNGSFIRPEATGYGLIYFVLNMLTYLGKDIKGMQCAVSGSGNVAQFAAKKLILLGATVLSLSDSRGALIVKDPANAFTLKDIEVIAELKVRKGSLEELAGDARFTWLPGQRPWKNVKKVDIALPCATQNENDVDDVEALVKAGCFLIAEGSNMGSTDAAVKKMEDLRVAYNESVKAGKPIAPLWYAPGKASNAGGVAVSALEMAQNSQRMTWAPERVDEELNNIMTNIFNESVDNSATYTHEDLGSVVKSSAQKADATVSALPSLVQGANITGFLKVANAMKVHGDWW
ncbi:NADP-specific glutamate dehydrogenase [Neocallimastix lanati (nom. inval.)]|jgi:glutamate dehydrogenase (NADP+)|uniref:Glutamate dehydrogenase n=1 Tax=Neocallimastix californiae TaxID=1754190 RepID=A0A1Y2CXI5_9FUNG|nr:NADP-specific glutamate dehydrogenase [Neocallimastix sp. JGI-2020a]ORY51743.1 NADP-specific glutamate dehydrogenase [Neocallimastix californiae]|eukprot:ORY51743.1 NADP-specific glutamate dehydrogenase [Neocallimastix californiae]